MHGAMESIFRDVFDTAESQLNLRWNMLRNQLSIPKIIDASRLMEVKEFAKNELAALVLHGGSAQHTGLPLTQAQKDKAEQKRRVAAAKAGQQFTSTSSPMNADHAQVPDLCRTAPVRDGKVCSSSVTSWAAPCSFWAKGTCKKGITC